MNNDSHVNIEKLGFIFTLMSVLFFNLSFQIIGSMFGILSAIIWCIIAEKTNLIWLFRLNMVLLIFNGIGLTKSIFYV